MKDSADTNISPDGSDLPEKILGKPDEQDVNESYQTLIKHYTDQFWSVVNRTNTTLLVWAGSLLLIFISAIIPLSKKLNTLSSVKTEYEKTTSSRPGYITSKPEKEDGDAGGIKPVAAEKQELLEAQAVERKDNQDKVKRLQETEAKLKGNLSAIKTPLGQIDIPEVYVPLLWSFLLGGLLVFFLQRRLSLQAMLAQIVYLQTRILRKPSESIAGMGVGVPFWLAPLPRSTAEERESVNDVREFIGWKRSEKTAALLTLACFLIAFAMQVWVIVMAFTTRGVYSDPQQTMQRAVAMLLILLLCVVACTCLLWPRVQFGAYPDQLLAESKRRRQFLYLSGAVGLLGLIYISLPRSLLPKSLTARMPRFKKRAGARATSPLPEQFHATFQLNSKSGVIHFINCAGWSAGKLWLNSEYFQPHGAETIASALSLENISANKKPHVDLSRWGFIAEPLALKKFAAGNLQQALDILWSAIIVDTRRKKNFRVKPSYRLYDLYAGLAVRGKSSEQLKKLDQYVSENWGSDKTLEARRRKWSKPPSAWVSKWQGAELPWKTPPADHAKDYRDCYGKV